MDRRHLLLGIAACATSAAAAQSRRRFADRRLPDLDRQSWKVGGDERAAWVHLPKTTAGAPLILAFHGHGGTMDHAARRFALEALWPEAVVVYSQGLPSRTPNDPDGRRAGWSLVPWSDNRDLKLVDAILETATSRWKVDPRRVFSMGHSNGAAFTYLLWGQRPDTFAALASVAGAGARLTRGAKPCPLLHIGAKNDPIVRWESQEEAVAAARAINGKGAPVELVTHDGGHAYPDDASARVVAFFRKHARSA